MRTVYLALFAAIAFVTAAGAPAQAQNARVTGAQIKWYGVYTIAKSETIADPSSPTGARFTSSGFRQSGGNTDRISLTDGIRFGFAFSLSGQPRSAVADIEFVHLYPAPGIDVGADGKMARQWRRTYKFALNRDDLVIGFNLGDGKDLPEGVWTFQIVHHGRVLAEKNFTVTRP
jgi:hypothetical protein